MAGAIVTCADGSSQSYTLTRTMSAATAASEKRSELVLQDKWDLCLANGLVKAGWGLGTGVVLSVLLFKRKFCLHLKDVSNIAYRAAMACICRPRIRLGPGLCGLRPCIQPASHPVHGDQGGQVGVAAAPCLCTASGPVGWLSMGRDSLHLLMCIVAWSWCLCRPVKKIAVPCPFSSCSSLSLATLFISCAVQRACFLSSLSVRFPFSPNFSTWPNRPPSTARRRAGRQRAVGWRASQIPKAQANPS